jgi:hypothetical protein
MIFPDYESIKEERICQECYGYTKGGADSPFVAVLIDPILLYFSFLSLYTATAGKVVLPIVKSQVPGRPTKEKENETMGKGGG